MPPRRPRRSGPSSPRPAGGPYKKRSAAAAQPPSKPKTARLSRSLRGVAELARQHAEAHYGDGKVPDELTDAKRGIRLQKALAEAGVASRRACEELIAAGRVAVNGQPVTGLPAWVDPSRDEITVDGQLVARPRRTPSGRSASRMVLMVNKPRRVISTNDDPEGRTTVLEMIDPSVIAAAGGRLYPVGRLDADSMGMMLMTNDGELANHLTHPRYGVTKQYQVTIGGRIGEEDLRRLRKGLLLATPKAIRRAQETAPQTPAVKRAAMDQVRILRHETDRSRGDRTILSVTLKEGQNREIRRLLARVGFKVRKLERMAIGPVRLKGVARGSYRLLTAAEARALRQAASHTDQE